MTHAVLVTGVVFALGLLMVIGLLSVLRDLSARAPLLSAMLHEDQDRHDGTRQPAEAASTSSGRTSVLASDLPQG